MYSDYRLLSVKEISRLLGMGEDQTKLILSREGVPKTFVTGQILIPYGQFRKWFKDQIFYGFHMICQDGVSNGGIING